MNARKNPLQADSAWELLQKNKTIIIGKGKKVIELSPSADQKEDILKNVLGRSGTLRAPTLQIGQTCYVGFNVDMYAKLTGK